VPKHTQVAQMKLLIENGGIYELHAVMLSKALSHSGMLALVATKAAFIAVS